MGMLHYKELDFSEKQENLNNYKKNDVIEVKIIEVKDEKIRFSKRALDRILLIGLKIIKKVGDIITTRIRGYENWSKSFY